VPPTLSVEINIAVLDCTPEANTEQGRDSLLKTPPTPRSTSRAVR
jgi:hypothetical protein